MFALSEMNDFWLYLVWGNVDGDMSRAAAATNAEQLILLQLSYKVWEQQWVSQRKMEATDHFKMWFYGNLTECPQPSPAA